MFKTLDKENILVTGGAGFMGSAFIRYLLSQKKFSGKVVNLDALTYAGNLANLSLIEKDARYFFVQGDIHNQHLLAELLEKEKISLVVHFAAETHVDRSIEDPLCFLHTNVLGTASLLEVIKKFPHVHFHHVSTDEVYGSLEEEGFFDENSCYAPNSPYAASKAASDHIVRSYSKTYGLSVTISHAGNNYGPYQFPEKLIPFMLMRLLKGETLPLYGSGSQVRDWLFVEDHAKAIEAILCNGRRGEVYNISSGEEKTNISLLNELIKLYCEQTQENKDEIMRRIAFVKDRPGHDFRYAMKSTKLHKDTGWKPSHTFCVGLEKTVVWYLQQPQFLENIEQTSAYQNWIKRQYREKEVVTCI